MANGELRYQADVTGNKSGHKSSGDDIMYNTMQTPRGGQYKLVLPDGTLVWLNAESSIRYPASFNGASREVSVKGEVYFEVARNQRQPFKVHVAPSPAVSPAEAQRRWGGALRQIVLKSKFWELILI